MRVGAIADKIGAIYAGTFGNQEVGACLCCVENDKEGNQDKVFDGFHKECNIWRKSKKKMLFLRKNNLNAIHHPISGTPAPLDP